MTTPPRPDQRIIVAPASSTGSRSGAGDIAGALAYPGVPSAVPNLLGAALFQQNTSTPTIITLPETARIWYVTLAYAIRTDTVFSGGQATVASVHTNLSGLQLLIIQLSVAGASSVANNLAAASFPGLPLVKGDSVVLNVNNGSVVADLFQQASVSVLYSIP